ncbi:S-adenosyl-L-methionine-dependent methyltransferase [Lentinula raphanica]|nr:S-adenosyl-L-methionine-dependent methyltransferase [Lentinula raphanica]
MSANQSDPLQALLDILSTQTAILKSAHTTNNTTVPSLDSPFEPTSLESDPAVAAARKLIVAAATQLIATVQSPVEYLQNGVSGMFDTLTLGFVIDVNVPEILKEAGTEVNNIQPVGLHVKELASAAGVDSSYLARVLRYLATRHVFKEVSPDVFAHNRLSSLLTKAKSLKEIEEGPQHARFDDAAMPAFLHLASDELFKASTALIPFMKNPQEAAAPFNIAYKTTKKMWEWTEEPGNEYSSRRFTAAMKNTAEASYPPELFTSNIDGDALKVNETIVDVGGGVGSVTLALRNAYPKLRYVVQDLEHQIVAARKFWDEKYPEAVKTGQVQLQAHNFFDPQPVKHAAIYFLRLIVHDWPDHDAIKILTNLRSAAGADSKLVLFEMLAKHIAEEDTSTNSDGSSAPYPLLSNYGIAGAGFFTTLDLALLTMYNGKERTYTEYTELGRQSGWELQEVRPGKLSTFIYSPI